MSFTLGIIKPDAAANPIVLKWISVALTKSKLVVRKGCRLRLSLDQAHRLYDVHRDKFYYSRLIRHVCSGTSIVLKLEPLESIEAEVSSKSWINRLEKIFYPTTEAPETVPEDLAIRRWRSILGPSKVFLNLPKVEEFITNSNLTNLRLYFGISDTRNVAHGSASLEELHKEYEIFRSLLEDVGNVETQLFNLHRFEVELDDSLSNEKKE